MVTSRPDRNFLPTFRSPDSELVNCLENAIGQHPVFHRINCLTEVFKKVDTYLFIQCVKGISSAPFSLR
jgi:hypothetical protein